MKQRAGVVLVVLTLGLAAAAQSKVDRSKELAYLKQTRAGVVKATKGLSPAQWNFKSGPDRWSVAEVTEHIAAAEDYLFGMVSDKVMKAPAGPAGEDPSAVDSLVLKAIPDRTNKAQAPEPLKPTNRFGSPQASLKHFLESRKKTLAFAKSEKGLREHAIDSPLGKKLDAYEWVLFIAAHSERHTKQILEVKADPNFPKK
jgi:hypothetical protein